MIFGSTSDRNISVFVNWLKKFKVFPIVKKGKATIFLNPALNEEPIIEKICRSFGLTRANGLTDIRIKNDNSWHYRYLCDK